MVKDLALPLSLLWLWVTAVAQIQALAQEFLHAMGAIKKKYFKIKLNNEIKTKVMRIRPTEGGEGHHQSSSAHTCF